MPPISYSEMQARLATIVTVLQLNVQRSLALFWARPLFNGGVYVLQTTPATQLLVKRVTYSWV